MKRKVHFWQDDGTIDFHPAPGGRSIEISAPGCLRNSSLGYKPLTTRRQWRGTSKPTESFSRQHKQSTTTWTNLVP